MAYTWVDPVPEDVVEALRGDCQLGVFFRIDTDDPLRFWLGVADIPAGFDAIDDEGSVYLGGGKILGVPTLEVLLMGTSDKVEFTLAGVDVYTGQQVIDSLPEVRGRALHVGVTTLDTYYQPMTAIIPLWNGVASHPKKYIPPVARGARSMTLGLVATGGNNTRARPARVFWTNPHHQSKHEGDLFCANTPTYGRGSSAVWPRF